MIRVIKFGKDIQATVGLTPSKSISNRVRIIQALADSKISVSNFSSSGDSLVLANALESFLPEINVQDAGTAYRFLTALLSIKEGVHILTGSERMKQRPVGALVKALHSLGADIQYLENIGYPPLQITGRKLNGRRIYVDASESSQFISALLLIAPTLREGLHLTFIGEMNSRPYITMTISLMKYFGVSVNWDEDGITVQEGEYKSREIQIENDWSAASFWYSIAALSENAEIRLQNISFDSIQGDVIVPEIFKNFGVISRQESKDIVLTKRPGFQQPGFFEFNFSPCPDLVIPVAFVCAALKIKSLFKGVRNLRIKESDRLTALKIELMKLGALTGILENEFTIDSFQRPLKNISFKSYNDHRMVMAEAVCSIVFQEIIIEDHLPVKKSYPQFWDQLNAAGFEMKIT